MELKAYGGELHGQIITVEDPFPGEAPRSSYVLSEPLPPVMPSERFDKSPIADLSIKTYTYRTVRIQYRQHSFPRWVLVPMEYSLSEQKEVLLHFGVIEDDR